MSKRKAGPHPAGTLPPRSVVRHNYEPGPALVHSINRVAAARDVAAVSHQLFAALQLLDRALDADHLHDLVAVRNSIAMSAALLRPASLVVARATEGYEGTGGAAEDLASLERGQDRQAALLTKLGACAARDRLLAPVSHFTSSAHRRGLTTVLASSSAPARARKVRARSKVCHNGLRPPPAALLCNRRTRVHIQHAPDR